MSNTEASNATNRVWKECIETIYEAPQFVVKPRGMEVRELKAAQYTVPMPAFIDLSSREVNVSFMFSEAAWILSGSNRVSEITTYMKGYANYSDDGELMSGAYGPKITDQWGYVVKSLVNDQDSRQAYINIWRERPGESKDIPCTVGMQFLIRGGKLHLISTMRSNDVVLGFTFDVFTFSMVANAVRLKLKAKGVDVELGDLTVQPGSLHLYERHYENVPIWSESVEVDSSIGRRIDEIMKAETVDELIEVLKDQAHDAKFYPERFKDES